MSTVRTAMRIVAVLAVVWAVADLCRWANRWYIATQWLAVPAAEPQGVRYLQTAHTSVLGALVALLVAVVAAGIGWRVRLERAETAAMRGAVNE